MKYDVTVDCQLTNNRISHPEVFCKKGVLRNFAKFIGKHLYQCLFFNKVAGLFGANNNMIIISAKDLHKIGTEDDLLNSWFAQNQIRQELRVLLTLLTLH